MKIILNFLTHETENGMHNRYFPLSLGLISEFIKTNVEGVETFLFKRPSLLKKFIEGTDNKPDIVMFGNYMWVEKLSLFYAKRIKSLFPKTLVVFGGPNLSLDENKNIEFLKENSFIDMIIRGDAEIASMHIVKGFIETNSNIEKLKKLNIPNTMSISKISDEVYKGENEDFRIGVGETTLEHIPSPYLSGGMDTFFEDGAIALLESTRGCPYGCTFCQQGTKYFSKIRYYNDIRILSELEYIAKKVKKESLDMEIVEFADPNFGMYKQDTKIFEHIRAIQDKYDFPKYVFSSSGKSQPERVLSNSKILKENSMNIRAAVQSMNESTLKSIDRKNLPTDVFKKLSKESIESYAETMLALPSESKKTYIDGISELIDAGIDEFSNHQTIILKGTPMEFDEYKKKYGMKTKYRVIAECDGVYKLAGVESRITETEQIVYETNTLPYDEYLECRKFALSVMIFHNTRLLRPLYIFLDSINISRSSLLKEITNLMETNSFEINKLYKNYIIDTESELSEKDLVFDKKKNIDDLSSNKLYKYSTQALLYYKSDVMRLIKETVKKILPSSKQIESINQILQILELSFLDTINVDEENFYNQKVNEIELSDSLKKVYNADCVNISLSDLQINQLVVLNKMYTTKNDKETKMPYHLKTINLIKSVNYYSLDKKEISWRKYSPQSQVQEI